MLMATQEKRQDVGWRDVSCDFGSLTSVGNDPVQQWIDSQATSAMIDCMAEFNSNSKGLTFTNFVFDYFHAPGPPQCGSLERASCSTPINCGQKGQNAPVSAPAGYGISLGSIEKLIKRN
jgi:hypothetical protein